MTTRKGMIVSIQGIDCTNNGVTSGHRDALLIGDGIPEIFEERDGMPTLRLEYDLEPRGAQAGRLMVAKPKWLQLVGAAAKRNESPFECFGQDWASQHRIVNAVAVPADHDERRWNMYGGHDVGCCDSRFPFTGPVPVHDRYE